MALALGAICGLAGCDTPDRAQQLAERYLIVDTHIDVPYRLYLNEADVSQSTESGDFDYPRAVAGGLDAPFMSIYIPASVDAAGGAVELADELIDNVEAIAAAAPDKFAIATCTADIGRIRARGRIALPLGMENGGPLAGDFANLNHFRERGIRYITLTHSRTNHISDSSYDDFERWQGLSPFGKTLIGEMNRLGVMIDVSHVSDRAFRQVLELTEAPVLATHSSLRHFTPGFHRNMSDDMVAALGANGGVIQINFGSAFLTGAAQDYRTAMRKATLAYSFTNQLAEDDPRIAGFQKTYRASQSLSLRHAGRCARSRRPGRGTLAGIGRRRHRVRLRRRRRLPAHGPEGRFHLPQPDRRVAGTGLSGGGHRKDTGRQHHARLAQRGRVCGKAGQCASLPNLTARQSDSSARSENRVAATGHAGSEHFTNSLQQY